MRRPLLGIWAVPVNQRIDDPPGLRFPASEYGVDHRSGENDWPFLHAILTMRFWRGAISIVLGLTSLSTIFMASSYQMATEYMTLPSSSLPSAAVENWVSIIEGLAFSIQALITSCLSTGSYLLKILTRIYLSPFRVGGFVHTLPWSNNSYPNRCTSSWRNQMSASGV